MKKDTVVRAFVVKAEHFYHLKQNLEQGGLCDFADDGDAEVLLERIGASLMAEGEEEALASYTKIAFYQDTALFSEEKAVNEAIKHGLMKVLAQTLQNAEDQSEEKKIQAQIRAVSLMLDDGIGKHA